MCAVVWVFCHVIDSAVKGIGIKLVLFKAILMVDLLNILGFFMVWATLLFCRTDWL